MIDPRNAILATLAAACTDAAERGNPEPLDRLHAFLGQTAATYVKLRSRAIVARARCEYDYADRLEATAASLLQPPSDPTA